MSISKPEVRPNNCNFSSGPCAKRPDWSVSALKDALVGRSHRSALGKARLKESTDRMASVLDIPKGYRVGIVAGSDTGVRSSQAIWEQCVERAGGDAG